ncbi:hypothetical protein MKC54_09465 [[Clostridium] innocuum]|nr:hypothetical protein [[Clostridium] innocuum]MCR0577114.1 hypothetical protein [[Clostridium] innocuum]
MTRKIKPVDYSLKAEVIRHLNNGTWVSASYSAFLYAESLRKNSIFKEALDYYVLAVYLDVSGLNASGGIDPLNTVLIGPKVMTNLHKVSEKTDTLTEAIENAYTIVLPFRYFEKDVFTRIIVSGITNGFDCFPHNEPNSKYVMSSIYDDRDESYYDLYRTNCNEWYEKYVQPDVDKIEAQRNAIDVDMEELELLASLEDK